MSYFCDICKKSYLSYHSYWTHKKLSHSITDKKEKNGISCEFCNKKYFNKYSLNRHLLKCSIKLYNEQQNNLQTNEINNTQANNPTNEKDNIEEIKLDITNLKKLLTEKTNENLDIIQFKLELDNIKLLLKK